MLGLEAAQVHPEWELVLLVVDSELEQSVDLVLLVVDSTGCFDTPVEVPSIQVELSLIQLQTVVWILVLVVPEDPAVE